MALGCQLPAAGWWVAEVEPVLGQTARVSHGFVRLQLLQFFFYFLPFHAWAAWRTVAAGGPARLGGPADGRSSWLEAV